MSTSQTPPAPVIGVRAGSGGLGASTLTTALAVRAGHRLAPVACVDGRLGGGGLDVTACVEHQPGMRWGDLAGVRGSVDGPALLERLPALAAVRVLSAGPAGVAPPPAQAVSAVLDALRHSCRLLVLDLPAGPGPDPFLASCDSVVLLSGTSARHVADATAVALDVAAVCPDVRLVVRTRVRSGGLPETIAAHLGLPLEGRWPDEGRLALEAERGLPPGRRARSPLAALCAGLLDALSGDATRQAA